LIFNLSLIINKSPSTIIYAENPLKGTKSNLTYIIIISYKASEISYFLSAYIAYGY